MDAKATKGPWFVVGPPWNDGPPFVNAGNADPHGGKPVCDLSIQTDHDDGRIESEPRDDEDAELIVTLRNALPALVRLIECADALRNCQLHELMECGNAYDAARDAVQAAITGGSK